MRGHGIEKPRFPNQKDLVIIEENLSVNIKQDTSTFRARNDMHRL